MGEHGQMNQGAVAPEGVPRVVTAMARRRAWGEPRVRAWWLAAAGVLAVGVYLGAAQAWRWREEAALLRRGVVVVARVVEIDNVARQNYRVQPPAVVKVEFELNGQTHRSSRKVESAEVGSTVATYQTMKIAVDPADPQRWTARVQPAALGRELLATWLLVPLAAVLGLAAAVARLSVLRTWRFGVALAALVVDVRQTALAPLSRVVRCTPREGRDQRIITVYLPQRQAAGLQAGDVVWLVAPATNPQRAIAAAAYEEGSG